MSMNLRSLMQDLDADNQFLQQDNDRTETKG